MDRAYSLFEVKSIDSEQRIIEGIASTPELDRGGDEMDPKGASFVLPMPLKWMHGQTVGEVIAATVTKAGISIKARMPTIDEPGKLKDAVDYAWQSVKFKLARGLSIGWRPIDAVSNGKGLKVSKWEWFETSVVDIPMNASATIASVKSFDTDAQPATRAVPPSSAGVSALRRSAGRSESSMNLSTQIEALTQTRIATGDRMKALMGESFQLDEAGQTEYDGLAAKLTETDTQIRRLKALEQSQMVEEPMRQVGTPLAPRSPYGTVQVKEQELPPGILYTRAILCKMQARLEGREGSYRSSWDIAKQRYPSHPSIERYLKTAIPAGTTTGSGSGSPQTGWGDDLAALNTNFTAGFMDFLRPMSIIGKLNLTRTPFNVRIQSQTTGGSARWVGQGLQKPVTSYHFDNITLGFAKLAAICVLADELIRYSTPNAETRVRDQLAATIVEKIDQDFIDPDTAAVANVSPASITRGLAFLNPTGTALANAMTDLATIVGKFITNKQKLDNLAWIMTNTTALNLTMMLNSMGNRAFPEMSVTGGTLLGYPVVTSQYLSSISSSPVDGNLVVLLNQSEIFLADDGQVSIDASDQASIEMSDDPATDSGTVQSMFQTNCVALRAERYINWARGRTSAVEVMGDVRWAA